MVGLSFQNLGNSKIHELTVRSQQKLIALRTTYVLSDA